MHRYSATHCEESVYVKLSTSSCFAHLLPVAVIWLNDGSGVIGSAPFALSSVSHFDGVISRKVVSLEFHQVAMLLRCCRGQPPFLCEDFISSGTCHIIPTRDGFSRRTIKCRYIYRRFPIRYILSSPFLSEFDAPSKTCWKFKIFWLPLTDSALLQRLKCASSRNAPSTGAVLTNTGSIVLLLVYCSILKRYSIK